MEEMRFVMNYFYLFDPGLDAVARVDMGRPSNDPG
jgi:hypothetical protein